MNRVSDGLYEHRGYEIRLVPNPSNLEEPWSYQVRPWGERGAYSSRPTYPTITDAMHAIDQALEIAGED